MADRTENPLRESDHLVDPPIIDSLYQEGDSFVIGFVPDSATSPNATEGVTILCDSIEGRQMAVWLGELGRLFKFGAPAERVFHKGGGDFGFTGGGRTVALSQAGTAPDVVNRAYHALQYLGQMAQAAFLIARRASGARIAPPVPPQERRVG